MVDEPNDTPALTGLPEDPPQGGPIGAPKPSDEPSSSREPEAKPAEGDATDWKGESRKHEQRAKQNKVAAEKAAADKAAADEAKAAAEAKNADLLKGIAKVLGLEGDDAPPDPAKLQQTIADRERDLSGKDDVIASRDSEIVARDQKIAARDVELAAWRVAASQGLDVLTLMDLRSTERRLGQLDPTSEDFGKQLESTIKELAKDNPALRKQQVSAADAGIGSAGSRAAALATPGTGRLRAAYGSA